MPQKFWIKLFWAGVIASLLPWFYFQFTAYLNTDIAILTVFAERFLNGAAMSEGWYDTNPPLSILFQVLPVLLTWITGLGFEYTTLLWSFLILTISFTLSALLLARLDWLDRPLYHLVLAMFLLGNTLSSLLFFGEKDQIVLLGLIPFILTQLCMSYQKTISGWLKWTALMIGTITILLKPHFGLIPTLLILHRAVKQRRLYSIPRDSDFLSLAVGVGMYLAMIILFFRDFVNVICPDVLIFYAGDVHPKVWPETALISLLTLIVVGVISTFDFVNRSHKYLVYALGVLTLLALIPYVVQLKGLYYHLMPAICLLIMTIGVSFYAVINARLSGIQSLYAATIMALGLLYFGFTPPFDYPTHKEFQKGPVSKLLKTHCPEPCRYFFINDTNDLKWQLSVYHDAIHSTRFSSLWFLPELIDEQTSRNILWQSDLFTEEDYQRYRHKYSRFITKDLKNYKPQLIMIVDDPKFAQPEFDFGEFFAYSENFEKQWDNYRLIGQESFNRRFYYKGTSLDYDHIVTINLYKRQAEQTLKVDAPEKQ